MSWLVPRCDCCTAHREKERWLMFIALVIAAWAFLFGFVLDHITTWTGWQP